MAVLVFDAIQTKCTKEKQEILRFWEAQKRFFRDDKIKKKSSRKVEIKYKCARLRQVETGFMRMYGKEWGMLISNMHLDWKFIKSNSIVNYYKLFQCQHVGRQIYEIQQWIKKWIKRNEWTKSVSWLKLKQDKMGGPTLTVRRLWLRTTDWWGSMFRGRCWARYVYGHLLLRHIRQFIRLLNIRLHETIRKSEKRISWSHRWPKSAAAASREHHKPIGYLRSDECDVSGFQHRHFRGWRHVVDSWLLDYNFLWLFSYYSHFVINLLVPIHQTDRFETYLYLLGLRCCCAPPMYAQLMQIQIRL